MMKVLEVNAISMEEVVINKLVKQNVKSKV